MKDQHQEGLQKIENLAKPLFEENGYELVETAYLKEGSRWVLRFFIDRPGGIGLDDCELMSKKVSKVLDVKDLIPHSYTLEISSPGIERPLKSKKDFERFKDHKVTLKTFATVHGKKNIQGILRGLKGSEVLIEAEEQVIVLPLESIASARLLIDF